MRRFAKALLRDTSGVILPYVTLMLSVIVGISLLALDGARYMSLQTQVQAAADALALAGAAELNGKTGARARATSAIANFLSNGLSGMGIATPPQYATPVFYSTLPAATQLPSSGTVAIGDADAHYVMVATTPVTVQTIFPVAYLSPWQSNSFSAGAQAVAGMKDQSFCGIPPVYICNPWEGSGTSLTSALADPAQRRRQVKLLNDGTSSPGHFGWLVPPDDNVSASNLQDWISRTSPKTCYSSATVSLNTGAKQSALQGFNVRLDIGSDSSHAPDVNVRKGYVAPNNGNWCNADLDSGGTRAMALPQDASFSASNFGNGQWNCAAYWSFNHQSASAPAGCGNAASTTISRYDVYQYEINNSLVADWSRGTAANNYSPAPPYNNNKGETGVPLCAGVGNAVQGRRVLPIAVIDCQANAAAMGNGNNADNIPVAGFVKFFITERVVTTGAASNRQLIGEFAGEVTGLDATIFQNVKLYR